MIRFALSCTLLALPLCGGDLSGIWPATLSSGGREVRLHLEFVQQGERLSGGIGIRGDFLTPLERVRLDGNTLSFEFQMPAGPKARFEGVVDGERASGQFSSETQGFGGELAMRRTGGLPRFPSSFGAAANKGDLAALSDEFDDPGTIGRWKNFSAAEAWPDRIEKADVNTTSAGHLLVAPRSGAWWAGYHGVYLFKEVRGDFVMTTRVKVTGRGGGEPSQIWTISGLLARAPGDAGTSREQRKENWVYLMTGRGPKEARVVDAKSTVDSVNAWDITPAGAGWLELRIARLGPLFVLLCRPEGGEWHVRKRILRTDLPEALQAGVNVTSDFKLSSTMPASKYNAELFPEASASDSTTVFDYVRFSRPALTPELGSKLASKEVAAASDADLLALFR